MNDDQVLCESFVATGKTSLDNGLIVSDGAGFLTVAKLTSSGNANLSTLIGGQSSTAPATAQAGSISTGNRISRVSPAGAITAVVLTSGVNAGQDVTVVNEAIAANTITFDVAGTSHVADGVSTVIPGLTAARFVWDSGTSLWYHCK